MSLKEDLIAFNIEKLELPTSIQEAAFSSGGYTYEKPMKVKKYDKKLYALQIELLKALNHIKEKNLKVAIIFEGRDAAGKGGAIARLTQHLNPRYARIIALSKPNETEKGQFYLQRYLKEIPSAGEIAIFDRSWYNRALVEPVLGFCKPEETAIFFEYTPKQEEVLIEGGVKLIKIWLSIGQAMQQKRLHARFHDPLKHWKLSPVDFACIPKWNEYSACIDTMLEKTSTTIAPWTIIKANDKMRARIAIIRHVLQQIDYPEKDEKLVNKVNEKIVLSAKAFLNAGGEE